MTPRNKWVTSVHRNSTANQIVNQLQRQRPVATPSTCHRGTSRITESTGAHTHTLTVRLVGLVAAHRTGLVLKHARVAALVAAVVDQLALLALVERHLATGADRTARLVLQQLPDRLQVCGAVTRSGMVVAFSAEFTWLFGAHKCVVCVHVPVR